MPDISIFLNDLLMGVVDGLSTNSEYMTLITNSEYMTLITNSEYMTLITNSEYMDY